MRTTFCYEPAKLCCTGILRVDSLGAAPFLSIIIIIIPPTLQVGYIFYCLPIFLKCFFIARKCWVHSTMRQTGLCLTCGHNSIMSMGSCVILNPIVGPPRSILWPKLYWVYQATVFHSTFYLRTNWRGWTWELPGCQAHTLPSRYIRPCSKDPASNPPLAPKAQWELADAEDNWLSY